MEGGHQTDFAPEKSDPQETSSTAAPSESPETNSTPVAISESPETSSTSAVPSESPETSSTPAAHSELPETSTSAALSESLETRTPVVPSESPETSSTSAAHSELPETSSTPAAPSESPETSNTPAAPSESPETSHTPVAPPESSETSNTKPHPKLIRVDADDVQYPQYAAVEGIYHLGETDGDFPSYYKEAGGECPIVTLQFDGAWVFKFGEDSISVDSTAENPSLILPRVLAKHGIISIRRCESISPILLDSEKLYTDETFPATDSSIGMGEDGRVPNFIVGWKRPGEIHEAKIVLFGENGPHPDDVLQGDLGDCWFLAAARGVAQNYPDDIRKCFPEGEIRSDGSVLVTLYDPRVQKNVEYLLDTLLPVKGNMSKDAVKEAFARFPPSEAIPIWSPLLEKAAARLFGNYMNLTGGLCSNAYQILGFEGVGMVIEGRFISDSLPPNSFVTLTLNEDKQKEGLAKDPSALHKQSLAFYEEKKFLTTTSELFSKMKTRRENGVISAGTTRGSEPGYYDKIGIVKGHAYNVRSLQSVTTADGTLFDLICVANPWGNYETKKTGPTWHDYGAAWKKYPEVFDQINPEFKDDGVFWMNFSDSNAFNRKEAPKMDDFLDYFGMSFYGVRKKEVEEDDVVKFGCMSMFSPRSRQKKRITLTDEDKAKLMEIARESDPIIQKTANEACVNKA